ncbi:MAG: methionine--tRNA ligase subunit beta, partial [Chitinophagales bacterium]|nr:methionine--tRNA ligase subunit beta [Chitinophagales bacterium]
YNLPVNVPGNEFMNLQGDKISTSRNWAIWVHEFVNDYPQMIDAFRYVICANIPETKDSEFTWNDFQTRVNSELVAAFGNFVNRIMVLNHKFFEGKVPSVSTEYLSVLDEASAIFEGVNEKISLQIEQFKFREALDTFMQTARDANKFLTDKEPWKSIKTNPNEAAAVLNASTQTVANLSILCQIFMPETAQKIVDMLQIKPLGLDALGNMNLVDSNHALAPNALLFEKIEDEFVAEQIAKLEKNKPQLPTKNYKPMKEEIQFDDFAKMDIRIGKITEAKKVEKADRLLQLTVDLGFETRTIISGIAEHFAPEDVVGKQVQVLVNLAPRKMRGIESQGMILFAEDLEGKLHFVSPNNDLDNGSTVS